MDVFVQIFLALAGSSSAITLILKIGLSKCSGKMGAWSGSPFHRDNYLFLFKNNLGIIICFVPY